MNKNIINNDTSNEKVSQKDELTDNIDEKTLETPKKNNSKMSPEAQDLLKELEDILEDVFKPREEDIIFKKTDAVDIKEDKPEDTKTEKSIPKMKN